jgi:transposase-like protein
MNVGSTADQPQWPAGLLAAQSIAPEANSTGAPRRNKAMKCPRCGSTKLRKSQVDSSRLELIIRPFVIRVRCYLCGHDFLRPTAWTESLPSAPKYRANRRAA